MIPLLLSAALMVDRSSSPARPADLPRERTTNESNYTPWLKYVPVELPLGEAARNLQKPKPHAPNP